MSNSYQKKPLNEEICAFFCANLNLLPGRTIPDKEPQNPLMEVYELDQISFCGAKIVMKCSVRYSLLSWLNISD